MNAETDIMVIGGGVVGLSVAYGLLLRGQRVMVLDEGDEAFRASRGNFGLIWVQGKGLKNSAYARWTRKSAAAWKGFCDTLESQTGETLARVQDGGYVIHMDEAELDAERKQYERLRAELGGDYPFEVMGRNALLSEEPKMGPDVVGALYCREDGHVNPLRLLRALAAAVRQMGGQVRPNNAVVSVTASDTGFRATTKTGDTVVAAKVVVAAGLGAKDLGAQLGFLAPIRPQQGQVLITEKMPKLMNRPNVDVRQVNEGGVQIGASKDEVGFDDSETVKTVSKLAQNAVRMFPDLARAKLVRSWAALRIMSPDGLPIYQKSASQPGAYFVTCHSGITLAANHALSLSKWILDDDDAPDLAAFSEERFDV